MEKLSVGTHALAVNLEFAVGELEGREIDIDEMRLEFPLDESDMTRIEKARQSVIENEAKRIEFRAPDSIKWPMGEISEVLLFDELETHTCLMRGSLVVTKTSCWFEVLVPKVGLLQSDSFEADPACLSAA